MATKKNDDAPQSPDELAALVETQNQLIAEQAAENERLRTLLATPGRATGPVVEVDGLTYRVVHGVFAAATHGAEMTKHKPAQIAANLDLCARLIESGSSALEQVV